MKIAVIDDNMEFLNKFFATLEIILKEKGIDFSIDKYADGLLFLNALQNKKLSYDLAFLDIEMPKKDGFDTIAELREINSKTFVIFVSTHTEMVFKSFNYQPFHFIPKNDFDKAKLEEIIDIFLSYNKQNEFLVLELSYKDIKKIHICDIMYISSKKNDVYYHLADGTYVIYREKLYVVESRLSEYDFARVHRRFVINMRKIQSTNYSLGIVTLTNGEEISISKTHENELKEKYKLYLRSTR
ncbi:hypothetical protein FACS189499_04670 [Clostridia bacterium]|nr:hypothetical protein FACS189499_04670 [Clostridia bacterium]